MLASLAMAAAADWLASSCTSPGGMLTVRPHGAYVSGYFGTISATGLAAARMHPAVVYRWMAWYIAHSRGSGSGVDGVPDDVDVLADGTVVSRGRPDSTDAYGAMFLMLARRAYAWGDPSLRALIAQHRADLVRIANSILATQQSNGLTLARPQHRIAYAIDNVQVYRGLLDGADLMESAYGDAAQAQLLRAAAAAVRRGIDGVLWDPAARTYRPAVDPAGTGPSADLSRAYPDALAQAYAVLYGPSAGSSAEAASLLARAAPALEHPQRGDAVEYRLVLALARRAAGSEAGGAVYEFRRPALCADAGWFLQLASQ